MRIDGKAISAAIRAEIKEECAAFVAPAFQTAFPAPDAPPVAILHADLRVLNALLLAPAKLPADGPPLPLDAFAYVTPDASLALRVRLPLAFLHAH